MTRSTRETDRWRSVACVGALLLAAAGCGGNSDAATEKSTHRSTAAAVIAALGPAEGHVSAVAPLFARDDVAEGDLGVEVAFARAGTDAMHVRLVIAHGGRPKDAVGCADQRVYAGCRHSRSADGRRVTLAWQEQQPEEDPGSIDAQSWGDGVYTVAYVYGPPIRKKLSGEPRHLADALVALVSDPDVGFSTTHELIDQGAGIPAKVVLDWYGQDNGVPKPKDYHSG